MYASANEALSINAQKVRRYFWAKVTARMCPKVTAYLLGSAYPDWRVWKAQISSRHIGLQVVDLEEHLEEFFRDGCYVDRAVATV
jgi:hypothetical protein